MLSCRVSVTIEYERPLRSQLSLPSFTRHSSLLAFVCFGTTSVVQHLKMISSDCFECYHAIALFSAANYCLFRDITEGDEHLIIILGWRIK